MIQARALKARFSDRVFCPDEALGKDTSVVYKTTDNKLCKALFLSTWNNADDYFSADFDDMCMRFWGIHFSTLRSVWEGRLGYIGDVWHLIELKEVV